MKISALIISSFMGVACAQTPATGDYQISGVVVDHLTNRPLNHVLVQVNRTGKGGGDASVLTDADGRFVFLHVPVGKYQLMAEKRGQTPQAFHADGPFSTAIVVDGTQKTDNIIFPLTTDAAISGTIISDDGEPVRASQVMLFREVVNNGEAQTVQTKSGTTNSEGKFHLGHLQPGKFYISAQARPWYSSPYVAPETVYPVTFYGDTTDGAAAKPIALAEGGTAEVQITLHAVPGIRVKMANGIQGVGLFVPGPGGTRIPVLATYMGAGMGIGVAVSGSRRPIGLPTPSTDGESTQTEMTNLAAGRYEVTMFNQRGGMNGPVRTVDLANGSTLSMEAPAGSQISGTVIFDGARPNGELEVFLSGGQRGTVAEVAADGTFKFDKATVGSFGVNLNHPGITVTSVSAKGARMVHDNLEVAPGSSIELTIHVSPSESLASINGFAVRDRAGVPGVMILLLPQDLSQARLVRRDQSDSDGSFTLASIQPGRYTLLAIDEGKDLAYKNEAVVKPYLEGGVSLTIPYKGDPLQVPVQTRKR